MGYDAYIELEKKSDKKNIISVLEMMNYKKIKKDYYRYFETEDDKSLYGNIGEFYYDDENKKICLHLRTPIWACSYDLFYMNSTIKQIKKLFNVNFQTDDGKNRYFKHDRIVTKGEAGVYKSYFNIENDFQRMHLYIQIMKDAPVIKNNQKFKKMISEAEYTESLFSTMGLPYLCSVIENYFRDTFIVLFKYLEDKERILKNIKYNIYDIEKVCNSEIIIEEAIARSMSFQNIDKILNNFTLIDSKLILKSCLQKPYHKRKESLYQALNRILEQRHSFIHSKLVTYKYDLDDFENDVKIVEVALKRVYKFIVQHYNWEDFVD